MDVGTAILCVALAVYKESRGEPILGQKAVAAVVWNRSIQKGKDACQVVTEKGQFPWASEHQAFSNEEGKLSVIRRYLPTGAIWDKSLKIAKDTLKDRKMFKGITHFHHLKEFPQWRNKLLLVMIIQNHKFYRFA